MRKTSNFLFPNFRNLSPNKTALVSSLDVGTSKVVCLIAKLEPIRKSDLIPGRTHRVRILGIGHQRSRGVKAGTVIDISEAEKAIRLAVDSAERMAGIEVKGVVANISGGRTSSRYSNGNIMLHDRCVEKSDIDRVAYLASQKSIEDNRAILHSFPINYSLDGEENISNPEGMIGNNFSVNLHSVSCDYLAAHNLILAIERSHISVEALVATPYASALSTLCDDEAELGTIIIDIGSGKTSVSVFQQSNLSYVDVIAIGGSYITLDIARGLSIKLDDAEKLKSNFGTCIDTENNSHNLLSIRRIGDDEREHNHAITLGQLTKIIRPRVEEILELVRERLTKAGINTKGQNIILTGGSSQIGELSDFAKKVFNAKIRIARPIGAKDLPDAAKNPAFSSAVGLLIYPQVVKREVVATHGESLISRASTIEYISRLGRWFKESF